nr:TRAM domain-containing protein [Herpetosiphon sp.]
KVQERIAPEINATRQDQIVEVLVEEFSKGKWRGRDRNNKLVFFEDERDLYGQLVNVRVTETRPWWLGGHVEGSETAHGSTNGRREQASSTIPMIPLMIG